MAKLRIPAMLVLFAAAAMLEAFRLSSLSAVTNGDIWWHLSSGLWILEHHAFPRSGLFSQALISSWIASSWAYDLLLASAYKLLGLRAIPALLMCLKTAMAVLTFLLAGGLCGRFWAAVALSAFAQYILGATQPGPGYFSILFFAVELLLLFAVRRSGSTRSLWWMPLLFLVWANVHLQFVYGVAVLLLFLACGTWSSPLGRPMALADAGKIAGASLVATLVTPYGYRPYEVFFTTTFSSANQYLPEFHAPGFRQPPDYLLMLLAMSAFLTVGLRRSRDPFQILLLAGCLGLSFYSQRDVWLVTVAALAVIGEAIAIPRTVEVSAVDAGRKLGREVEVSALAALAILVVAVTLRIPRSRETLLAKAGQSYPVAACDYIRDHRLAQPLFNAYEWGGFVTWYLPEYPVAIDGRADLYGADVVTEYSKVMNADVRYTEYPALAEAQTILLPKKAIMATALSSVPAFKVAYSDGVTVVLSRRGEEN